MIKILEVVTGKNVYKSAYDLLPAIRVIPTSDVHHGGYSLGKYNLTIHFTFWNLHGWISIDYVLKGTLAYQWRLEEEIIEEMRRRLNASNH